MVEKKHSFAKRRTMSLGVTSATSRFTRRYCYRHLRRLQQIAGKGGRLSLLLLLAAAILVFPCRKDSAAAAVDAASVQRAIDRGITYLRKSQNERGGWEEFAGQSCGLSALCTLALSNSGVPKVDPDMVRAMRYLRSFEPDETYSVALQTLVYCQLGAAGDLPRIRRNVRWLVSNQRLPKNPSMIRLR